MNIITVVPISRQKLPPTLTYFTAQDVPVGAVVTIPVRSKPIPAIVSETRAAVDLKAEIRNAPYEIKKLGKVRAAAFFTPGFIDACRSLADHYATTLGAIVGSLVPDAILESAHRINPPLPVQPSLLGGPAESGATPAPHDTFAVQGDEEDRMSAWRSLIRQQFARKRSVAVYAPTIEDAKQVFAALEKGIEGYIFMLHGGLTKKKILDAWAKIAETRHSVVVVATPAFSMLPRGDVESIVLERENGRGWMAMKSPAIDMRRALETIARREKRTVFLSDSLLRAETLRRAEEHDISSGTPFKWRSISTARDILVSMKRDRVEAGRTEPFRVLGDELLELIRRTREDSANMFVMASRRGLAPVTVCDDCESIVSCPKCGAPFVLHTSKQTGKNLYVCHSCGERASADMLYPVCGGHRLSPLGIGVERVKHEIKKAFPDADIFQVDSDSTSTEKQVADAIERWRAKPGAILVGTELALHRIAGAVDHVAVASIDSLFALPDFRIEERIMYALLRLRGLAARTILVQTRRPEEKVFEYGLKGNLSDFYRSVLAERKKFGYPPFSLLLKVTLEGKRDQIAREMGELQAHLAPHEIDVFPAYTATDRGTAQIHGLMKIPEKQWPDMELVEKLRMLPPDVSVKVNPESLL